MEDEAKHNIDKLIDDLNNLRLEVSLEECPNVDQVLDSVVNVSKTSIEETIKVIINRILLKLLGHKSKQIVAKTTKAIAEIAKTDQGKKKCTAVELIRALIDLLKEDDIDILTQACRALRNICDENGCCNSHIYMREFILHNYLLFLNEDDEISRFFENGKKLVKEQDGLKVILTVLKKGIALNNVEGASFLLIEATHLLFIFLQYDEALCIKALEEGMLPIICSILKLKFQNGSSNDRSLELVCGILQMLEYEDIVFLDERLARVLVDIVTMDFPFNGVLVMCFRIFCGQAWKDEKARLVLAKAGVYEWLLKLLQKQSNDKWVQYYLPRIRDLMDLMLTGVGLTFDRRQEPITEEGIRRNPHGNNCKVPLIKMEPLIDLVSLEMAGKMVDEHIIADSNFPSLINLMRYNVQGGPTVSGLDDQDYSYLTGASMALTNINQIKIHSKIPLPAEVMEHFGHAQCNFMMGLFTEISRAWLTIDSDIYLWSYENESDVAYFDGLNETIISIGLVKPKTGIFQTYVNYLLILTTTVEITILGVTIPDEGGKMQLVSEPIFTVTTDGIEITTIANTSSDRIFLGGRNGSLFEIYYQAESSWFGKRCKKVNHSKGPLSFLVPSFVTKALSEEEAIIQISVDDSRNILYTLGDRGTITVWDIDDGGASKITSLSQASLAKNAVHVVKTLDNNNFRPLVSISAIMESESVHLNLVVVAATGTRFYFSCTSITNPSSRPQGLQLIHVRLPPGYAANATVMRKVQMAYYRKGTLFLVCGGDAETAWCLSNDTYPLTNYLAETQSVLPLDSPVWAVKEIIRDSAIHIQKQSSAQGEPPLLVRQHMEPPRKFIFLTEQEAIILMQVDPVDILKQLLLEQCGPDTEVVRAYFQTQSLEQACATCLILATQESSQNAQLSEWATRAFFLYSDQRIAEICSSIDMHNRLYLYVGRILRPIWNVKCIKQETISNKNVISSTVPATQIACILSHLQALRSSFNKNTHITRQQSTSGRDLTDGFETTIQSFQELSIVEERNSLDALKVFITHACEVLSLWEILCENQLNNIVNCLSKDQITKFSTARDMILMGHEISSLLIVHLIDSYLGDNASADSVSAKLREVCPNLYRTEDAVCSKANEILLKAEGCTNPEKKECYLQSALTLYKEVAPRLNLNAVCQQFVACQFYRGGLELCICCAERIDPKNAASYYCKNSTNDENLTEELQEGYLYFKKRHDIYMEFLEMLDHLKQTASNAVVMPAKEILHEILDDTLIAPCETLRDMICDLWMMNQPLHEKNKLCARSAKILESLASKVGSEISLAERVEYLEWAIQYMYNIERKPLYQVPLYIFLRELEDKLDVAKMQQQILETISNQQKLFDSTIVTDAKLRLNSSLLPLSQLYEYAEPLQLWECMLAIQYYSRFEEDRARSRTSLYPDQIEEIWTKIIDNELKDATERSNEDKMTILKCKIKLLSEKYIGSDCFPIDVLVEQLATKMYKHQACNTDITTFFLELGVAAKKLLNIYKIMQKSGKNFWRDQIHELELINADEN